jgi:hypothetical protein
MKRLLTGALALLSFAAFAATTTPVQLLNPAGSTAGQVIVSTGATTAPAWGAATLAPIASNTVLGNTTGSSAIPGAISVSNCAGASSALNYTAGSGFGCNATINAVTLGGATFSSPGPIGSVSSSSGAFSSLSTPSATIGGGTIDNTAIGATASRTGKFTTLNASGNDALLYQNSSAQSIPSGVSTTVTGWTKVYDRVNANFNAATGVFTAPETGYYMVTCNLTYSSATGVLGSVSANINVNGTIVAAGQTAITSTSAAITPVSVTGVVLLNAGQTVIIQTGQNSGSARTLGGSTTDFISIARLP